MFAPFNSAIKNKIGAKNLILLGFFLLTTTTVGLGAISMINDPHDFKYMAVSLRFLQGTGDVMIQFTCYSVITNVFSDNMMKYIGYCEIYVGIGLGLGPMIGSAVYPYLKYDGTMYFFGGLNVIVMIICIFFIPS
jgi:MFS family permease